MRITALFTLFVASHAQKYTCLTTAPPGGKEGNCAGASPATSTDMKKNTGESFIVFAQTMCCRPGSGKSPAFVGFNCMCDATPPGVCADDPSGMFLEKLGQNCAELIKEGGGKPAACSKKVGELTAEKKAKAKENGAAGIDVTVGGQAACAFSCGTCKCEDDADGVIKNQCSADPSKCEGISSCPSALKKFKCTDPLSNISPKIPDTGLSVGDVCPESCGACGHKSEVKGLNADGALKSESSTPTVAIAGGVLAGLAAVVAVFVVKARRNAGVEVPTMTPALAQL